MTAAHSGALAGSSLAEVAWLDASGRPRAAGVLPLRGDGASIVLALTFDRAALAVDLAAAVVVDLVVREPRNTAPGWRPQALRCTSRLVEDLDGELFDGDLLRQELHRYPPARRYADSPLLAREHWWYLPRLLVVLEPDQELDRPAVRHDASHLLLVGSDGGTRPVTSGVRRGEGGRLTPTWGPEPARGAALLHDQDATFPDLERWTTWGVPATVADGEVRPDDGLPEPVAPRMPGLAERWRAERRFAADCRRGLAAWSG